MINNKFEIGDVVNIKESLKWNCDISSDRKMNPWKIYGIRFHSKFDEQIMYSIEAIVNSHFRAIYKESLLELEIKNNNGDVE